MKLCPKCADMIMRQAELNIDIAAQEPSWRFVLRSKLAKPFFRLGSWILGMKLTMRRTWGIHEGGKSGSINKG